MADSVCVFVVDDDALILMTVEHVSRRRRVQPQIRVVSRRGCGPLGATRRLLPRLDHRCEPWHRAYRWDVARRAREKIPTLPVVYVTGDSAHEWAAQGVPNSVMISKPFVAAQIVNAVSTLLNGGPHL